MADIAQLYGLKIEFTSPHTPQVNGVVERRIAALKLRSQAMMNQADQNKELKNKLWIEAIRCANVLENITATLSSAKSPYELYHGKKPD